MHIADAFGRLVVHRRIVNNQSILFSELRKDDNKLYNARSVSSMQSVFFINTLCLGGHIFKPPNQDP